MRPNQEDAAAFYQKYIALATGEDPVAALRAGLSALELLDSINEEKALFAYASGKWNIKTLVQHIIDSERVFTFRALHFSRADTNPLAGFEEDDWAKMSDPSRRSFASIQTELQTVRLSTIQLFESFNAEQINRFGIASGQHVTVNALGFIMAGHCNHHINILRERYLNIA